MTWAKLAGHAHAPSSSPPPAKSPTAKPKTPIASGAVAGAKAGSAGTTPMTVPTGSTSTMAGLKHLIPVSGIAGINSGLTAVNNAYMIQKYGHPRLDHKYDPDWSDITNPKLLKAIITQDVGPFKATGLAPAVASLKQIFAEVKSKHFDVYQNITNGGMRVCRLQRGSKTAISNHSWGTAIDLGFGKDSKGFAVVDPPKDHKTYFGLALIAPIFNAHGWYWGASFSREDAMHFEGSKRLIDSWSSALV
jgi:hypothetical protein